LKTIIDQKCKKCHIDAGSNEVSKNTDSPSMTKNEDDKHAVQQLLPDNGQVHGVDLVDMVDGVLKD